MSSCRSVQEQLSEDCNDHWVGSQIKVLDNPTPLEFLRDCVSAYEPCIIRGAIDHWPLLNATLDTLFAVYDGIDKQISVNITPDGLGDCVKSVNGVKSFTYPAEVQMSIQKFKSMMLSPMNDDAVPYASMQNDCLRKEFPELLEKIDVTLPVAKDVFYNPMNTAAQTMVDGTNAESGNKVAMPEAVNLWIGDERSISSVHKDFFENMYCVLSGQKTFTLLTPTDIMYLPESRFPCRRYQVHQSNKYASEGTHIQCADITSVPVSTTESEEVDNGEQLHLDWIDFDPAITQPMTESDQSNDIENDFHQYAHPLHVTVGPGEILYIPALWYHRVSQTTLTIAVNYWYEQRFDFRYVYYKSACVMKTLLSSKHDQVNDSDT